MEWTEYIQPELLILVPVLMAIGKGLKSAEWIANKHIPVCLGIIGMALSALWVFATTAITGAPAVAQAVLSSVTQGVLVAAGAVYAHNIYKENKTSG